MKNRWKTYLSYIKDFGVFNGIKITICGWLSHFYDGKYVFWITNPKVQDKIWLRINTTDLHIASELLGREGEYDFIAKIPGIDKYKCVVDAGANIGLFSTLVRKSTPMCKIIAIEPDYGNFKMLERNISPTDINILYNSGLWSKECKLSIKKRNTGEIGFVVNEDPNGQVNAISMQHIIDENEISWIDILKIDIEGSEYEVFDETSDSWIEKVGILIIETHDRIKAGCSERVHAQMTKYGFYHTKYFENDIYYRDNKLFCDKEN